MASAAMATPAFLSADLLNSSRSHQFTFDPSDSLHAQRAAAAERLSRMKNAARASLTIDACQRRAWELAHDVFGGIVETHGRRPVHHVLHLTTDSVPWVMLDAYIGLVSNPLNFTLNITDVGAPSKLARAAMRAFRRQVATQTIHVNFTGVGGAPPDAANCAAVLRCLARGEDKTHDDGCCFSVSFAGALEQVLAANRAPFNLKVALPSDDADIVRLLGALAHASDTRGLHVEWYDNLGRPDELAETLSALVHLHKLTVEEYTRAYPHGLFLAHPTTCIAPADVQWTPPAAWVRVFRAIGALPRLRTLYARVGARSDRQFAASPDFATQALEALAASRTLVDVCAWCIPPAARVAFVNRNRAIAGPTRKLGSGLVRAWVRAQREDAQHMPLATLPRELLDVIVCSLPFTRQDSPIGDWTPADRARFGKYKPVGRPAPRAPAPAPAKPAPARPTTSALRPGSWHSPSTPAARPGTKRTASLVFADAPSKSVERDA